MTALMRILLCVFSVFSGAQAVWAQAGGRKMVLRDLMVTNQIERRGVQDRNVLAAMRRVERHLFVSESEQEHAYEDHPLPIGYGQTISQPFIVAYMTEALELKGDDRVLEIGTGSGYQAAVLSEIVKEVYTIEIIPALAESTKLKFKELGYGSIHVKTGDGFEGWPEHAPYDAVIVTAAPEEIPEKLIAQMNIGGRMVIPVGSGSQELILIKKTATGIEEKSLLAVRFVPMVQEKE